MRPEQQDPRMNAVLDILSTLNTRLNALETKVSALARRQERQQDTRDELDAMQRQLQTLAEMQLATQKHTFTPLEVSHEPSCTASR